MDREEQLEEILDKVWGNKKLEKLRENVINCVKGFLKDDKFNHFDVALVDYAIMIQDLTVRELLKNEVVDS